jgi:predicted KAP-like P-loop ATPase
MGELEPSLSADEPLGQPEADNLGFAPFARHLADTIAKLPAMQGIVIALNGPWGSGKTTILTWIEHFLQEAPENERVIVVTFNPWWFSGHEDLARRFFDQLSAILSNKLKSAASALRKQLADFASVVSDTPLPYTFWGKIAARVLTQRPKDVPQLKRKLAELLKKQNKRILVIVDDIDRLTAEEVRQLFRVIKAVGDFPNVTYLLAFDREMVVNALNSVQAAPGDGYLEKIVQLPVELPLPDKSGLEDMLLMRLNQVLEGTPEELSSQAYWNRVYVRGISHFLTTPRDVVRLVNGLTVTYAAVKGEVNAVDFVAIETLRIFSPEVYSTVRQNDFIFARYPDSSIAPPSFKKDHKAVVDGMLEQLRQQNRKPVKDLLFLLFPRLEGLYGQSMYGSHSNAEWRRTRRICSIEVLPTYFRLAVPAGSVSRAEIQALLNLTSDPDALAARLQEFASQRLPNGSTRLRIVLDQLQDYTAEGISQNNIDTTLDALFRIADQLILVPDVRQGIIDLETDVRLGRLVMQLLDRLEPGTEFAALRNAVVQGQSVFFAVRTVVVLGQEHGKYGSEPDPAHMRRHVTLEQLDNLETLVIGEIQDAAASGRLLSAPHLPSVLNWWRDHRGDKEIHTWIDKVLSDQSQTLTLVEQFGRKTYSQSFDDIAENMKTAYQVDPRDFAPFVDPAIIAARLKRVDLESASEEQQRAVAAFIKAFGQMELGDSSAL